MMCMLPCTMRFERTLKRRMSVQQPDTWHPLVSRCTPPSICVTMPISSWRMMFVLETTKQQPTPVIPARHRIGYLQAGASQPVSSLSD